MFSLNGACFPFHFPWFIIKNKNNLKLYLFLIRKLLIKYHAAVFLGEIWPLLLSELCRPGLEWSELSLVPVATQSKVLQLGYSDRGFESLSRHGSLSVCFCVVLSFVGRSLQRADHWSKEVLLSVLIRSRNLRCEAAKVLTRTVDPLMMIAFIFWVFNELNARENSGNTVMHGQLFVTCENMLVIYGLELLACSTHELTVYLFRTFTATFRS
jgi:hypothetical protein